MRREYVGYRDEQGEGSGAFRTTGLTDEEIVRCADCAYSRKYGLSNFYRGDRGHDQVFCRRLGSTQPFPVEDEGYCYWGVRRP